MSSNLEGMDARADDVDRIVEAWHRVRPELDVAPLAVFSRITRIARRLDLARRRALAAHGIEVWEFDVLTALRRLDEPEAAAGLTPGALMAELLVSSGTMTNRLQRMEAHGLVSRVPDPADRRVVRVRITPAGAARVDATLEELLADERRLLEEFGAQRADELAGLLRALLVPLESDDSA